MLYEVITLLTSEEYLYRSYKRDNIDLASMSVRDEYSGPECESVGMIRITSYNVCYTKLLRKTIDSKKNYALKSITKYDRYDKEVRCIKLDNNDYFDSDPQNSSIDYLEKRLKLSGYSINENSTSTNPIEVYSFEYDETYSLPKKNSKAVDYWGYYNGESNTYLFPNLLLLHKVNNLPKLRTTTGGNRGTDEEGRFKAWSLKKINLPTGGAIVYDFEAHRFNNFIMPNRQEMKEGSISSMIEYKQSGYADTRYLSEEIEVGA